MTRLKNPHARLPILTIALVGTFALIAGPLALPAFAALIDGTPGDDELVGTDEDDQIFGREGDDMLSGLGGDDQLWGEAGDDQLYGGPGNDSAMGGTGNDIVEGGIGNDNLYGGAGHDRVYGGPGDDYIAGDDGDFGDSGADGDDFLYGGSGNDEITGDGGDDYIEGGIGNDTISGGTGNDEIYGGSGDDIINGGPGNDFLCGGGDAGDELYGGVGSDLACAHDDAVTFHVGDTVLFDPTTNDEVLLDDGVEDVPSVYSLTSVPAELSASIDTATGVITLAVTDFAYTGGIITYRVARDHADGNLHSDANIDVSVLARTYTVNFDTNGGTAVPSATVDHGDAVAVPAAPTLDDHAFTGWFTDAAATAPYDFASPVMADTTLYAGWDLTELGTGPVLPGDGDGDDGGGDSDGDSGGTSGDPGDGGGTPGDGGGTPGDPGDPGDSTPEATATGARSLPGGELASSGGPVIGGAVAAAVLALTLGTGLVLRKRRGV